jgi:hypothetical protein
MIALLQGVPLEFQDLVRTYPRHHTRVYITPKLTYGAERMYQRYRTHVDYMFILGYLASLKEVPCAGNITIVAMNKITSLTGAVHVWSKEAGLVIDELGDILDVAAKRFSQNHPKVSLCISATLEPTCVDISRYFLQPPTRR